MSSPFSEGKISTNGGFRAAEAEVGEWRERLECKESGTAFNKVRCRALLALLELTLGAGRVAEEAGQGQGQGLGPNSSARDFASWTTRCVRLRPKLVRILTFSSSQIAEKAQRAS